MNMRLNLTGVRRVTGGLSGIRRKDLLSFRNPPQAGTLLHLQDPTGDHLAHAVSEGAGQPLVAQVLSRERHPELNAAFFAGRVEWSLSWRNWRPTDSGALRLVDGEADGMPGVFCDWAGGLLVLEVLSPGMAFFSPFIEDALWAQVRPSALWRRMEGEKRFTLMRGRPGQPKLKVRALSEEFWLRLEEEEAWDFDLKGCADRARLKEWKEALEGREALCLFSRGGAWAWAALDLGASKVLAVDKGAGPQARAKESLALNPKAQLVEAVESDAFKALEKFKSQERRFGFLSLQLPRKTNSSFGRFLSQKDWSKLCAKALPLLDKGGLLALGLPAPAPGFDDARDRLLKAGEEMGMKLEALGAHLPGPGFRASAGLKPEGEGLSILLKRIS